MLVPYLLLSCVRLFIRLSVRPLQAGIVLKRLDELSWYLAWRRPSIYPTLRCKEIWVSQEIRVLSSGIGLKLRIYKILPWHIDHQSVLST